jgi:hypothetical protein
MSLPGQGIESAMIQAKIFALTCELGIVKFLILAITTKHGHHVSTGAPATDDRVHEGRRVFDVQRPAPRISEIVATAAAKSTDHVLPLETPIPFFRLIPSKYLPASAFFIRYSTFARPA